MSALWSLYIEPFIRRLEPRRVMQIGSGDDEASLRLLAYCRESGCRADIVEPRPTPELEQKLAALAGEHAFFKLPPLKAIPMAEHPDLMAIEGEPNWWTITTALDQLRNLAIERELPFPFLFVRHVAGPYARRDMYPRPEVVDEKHPFAYQGLEADGQGLVEDGLNNRFAHALHEGGPRNGVLTALEDFVANTPFEVGFWSLPFFDGLAILAPRSRMTPQLQAVIDGFYTPESLLEAGKALEAEAFRLRAQLAASETRLERRTSALKRARELLARHEAEIVSLGKQLGTKSKAGA